MTTTYWLLAGLAVIILIVIALGYMIEIELLNDGTPIYRTADATAIRRQTRRLVPNADATANTQLSAPQAVNPNMQSVRREGTAAALSDLRGKPGTPATTNPHSAGPLARFVWRDAYNRASTAYQFKAVP